MRNFMNVEKPKSDNKRASTDDGLRWDTIDWEIVTARVSKLQSRIAKASTESRMNLVKKLQYLLSRSIKDRAIQALYLLGLDPVSESLLDKTSFGFRKHRSAKDACEYLFKCLSLNHSSKWVLQGDIKAS